MMCSLLQRSRLFWKQLLDLNVAITPDSILEAATSEMQFTITPDDILSFINANLNTELCMMYDCFLSFNILSSCTILIFYTCLIYVYGFQVHAHAPKFTCLVLQAS